MNPRALRYHYVAIQIEQKFPRCQRCGRMIHLRADRIEATGLAGEHVVLCSEICRSEYEQRFGLAERGEWRSPAAATTVRQ